MAALGRLQLQPSNPYLHTIYDRISSSFAYINRAVEVTLLNNLGISHIMRCGYEVPGMGLLQAYPYTYSLLRGVIFEVLPLSSYALSRMMLPLLETFLEL
jgi:hypothetical protein